MSLAARCPACGTVFRVVQDQLRVSEGWVRCGRCAEVFNAIESLVDLDLDLSQSAPRSRGQERVIEDMARVSRYEEMSDLGPLSTFGTPAAPPQAAPRKSPPPPAAAPTEAIGPASEEGSTDLGEPPAFVRRAERAARWRRPGVRALLGGLAALGTLGLLGQVAIEYRHETAARWPVARPALETACEALGCRIEAPRAIEALAVESSGLLRIEGTALYRLSVVLRNRSNLVLALPALDLTLTDSQGSVMARRVIQPLEMGAQRATMAPMAELPLQATLSAADRPISGYTIEIFYP
jgi:predicted Zn finger-like uncharacterized protein